MDLPTLAREDSLWNMDWLGGGVDWKERDDALGEVRGVDRNGCCGVLLFEDRRARRRGDAFVDVDHLMGILSCDFDLK
jgi:hypothetical protein